MIIILDRDGVINKESCEYIKSPAEWQPIPGSLEAIVELKNAGFQVVVATNQSGIARGFYNEDTLRCIHLKMIHALKNLGTSLDGIFYCPHHPDDQCLCRKPKPGLFLTIAEHLGTSLKDAIAIGDSKRDIEAALAVNIYPKLVLTGNGKKTLPEITELKIPVYQDLAHAACDIISKM